MQSASIEKLLSRILAYGAAFTTIFLISGSVTDPVNTPKLLAVGVVASVAFGLLFSTELKVRFSIHKSVIFTISLFMIAMIFSAIKSNSPFSQNIYGSYGRNNGLVTYLFFSLVMVAALTLREVDTFKLITKALFIAGIVNVSYCLWVILFGDFIGWSNPYGNILGTLGNPDFIGAFLGFFFGAYLAVGVDKNSSKVFKLSMLVVLPITAYEIVDSHAIQGRVVALFGVGIVGFFYLRSKFQTLIVAIYSILGIGFGTLAVAGALQIGPLTKYIYKTSVSLRGQYWLAAWNTGQSHPFNGVGMDSFGDWYRRSRDAHAIVLPGVNTTVNAAHNVWMDMFASGGWPLLLSYLAILAITAISVIKVVVKKKSYDPTFVAMVTAWLGYQAQSIISINQIGLAIWGWLLSGSLIAYEVATREPLYSEKISNGSKRSKSKQSNEYSLAVVIASITGLLGLLLTLPPLVSDAKWRSAQLARTVPALEATMSPGYFNPQNTNKYITNIQTLEASNLFELSRKYALKAVKWNPESYELWRVLYLIKNSTPKEKALALSRMKQLDPLNPDVTAIK